jgi:hypothetical protein
MLFFVSPVLAATGIPFTINVDDTVIVTGTPRIQIDVGGTTRYATYTSGSGTSSLVFTYTMVSGDVDLDGVILSSPIQLNGGTIRDAVGNNAVLTFTPPDTSGVIVNATVPSGYTVAFGADTVTNANKTALSFDLTYPKANKTLNYSIASSGGGTPITGTLATLAGTTTVSGINATTLPDGVLTLSAYLSDTIGGTGVTVTDTIPMAVLDVSLVGHWTFDTGDISGTTAFDRSGNSNNGTITNGPTQMTGKVGGALNFDGVDDFVNLLNNPISGTQAFTLFAWGNSTTVTKYSGSLALGASAGLQSTYIGTVAGAQVGSNNSIGGGFYGSNYGSSVSSVNQWNAVILTFSGGAGGTARLYVNGTLMQTVTLTPNITGPIARIGRIGTDTIYNFSGRIDDVRIYNRALTPTEVTTLYTAMQ